ncbi:MAG: ABC transporter permease [Eubacterium sp.]|jgi:Ribose/xylose/arabinose/galactoside ABC-type transport systems, permease components|nr:ABC transporter permease [Eubacterium sp.]
MMKQKLDINKMVPVISLVVILVVFAVLTQGNMFSAFNLKTLVDQTVILLIMCSGAIFVITLGCSDLSVGVVSAMCALVSDIVFQTTGNVFLMIVVAVAIGLGFGALNGVINAKFKVPSFMETLAILIGLRGIINFIQSKVGVSHAGTAVMMLQKQYVKLPILIAILLVSWYLLERSSFGRNAKAIGENEIVAKYVGKSVDRTKILCFMLSGLTAAIAGFFIIARSGGTSTTMGTMFEMRTLIAIYVGGVLVRGGATATTYKVIIGCFVVTIIENGLKIMGFGSSEVSELVEGILLMVILFITIRAENYQKKTVKRVKAVRVK